MAQSVRYKHATLTYEQFLDWPGENQFLEWVDGEVVELCPVSDEHEHVRGFLFMLLMAYVTRFRLGVVRGEPYNMKTGPSLPGRSPDIMFISNDHRERVTSRYLNGPADLAVEVISPDSRTIDTKVKLREYESGGVREYWIFDPYLKSATFYRINASCKYELAEAEPDGTFRSAVVPGFSFNVGWLWMADQPDVIELGQTWIAPEEA